MIVINQPGFKHTFGTTYSFTSEATKVENYAWLWRWFFGQETPN
jgi:hypothetical protein